MLKTFFSAVESASLFPPNSLAGYRIDEQSIPEEQKFAAVTGNYERL
jgi:hypothetical protein